MDEQARHQENESHEKAVVEQHDEIETEPADAVAIAEIRVVDDGMVEHHQQRRKRAGAVERDDAAARHGSLLAVTDLLQHRSALVPVRRVQDSADTGLRRYDLA